MASLGPTQLSLSHGDFQEDIGVSGLRKLSHSWLTAHSRSGKLPDTGKEPFQRGIINKQPFTLPIPAITSEEKRTI